MKTENIIQLTESFMNRALDGLNELKTCSSEGKEYIYKFQKPPMAPMITGPERVKPGIEYDYSFMSTDPEDDFLSYYIDWGDGTSDGWTDYSDSGEEITLSHTWDKMKLFNFIRCRARDNNGGISDWSKYWVPINKETSQIHILRFFKDFPLLNWLLKA